jgi:hypothetical protein
MRVTAGKPSPHHSNSVSGYLGIAGQDRQLFQLALRYQYAIEGVAVVVRECKYMQCVSHLDGQHLDGIDTQLFGNEALQIGRQLELAEATLDGDFPTAGCAQKWFGVRILHDLSGTRGELWVVGDPPEKGVRV